MARPGSAIIPPGWSEHHRPTVDTALTATATISRPSSAATFNETTGRSEYPAAALVHSGPCRVQVLARVAGGVEVGDAQVTIRPYQVSWPADIPEVRVNDQVTIDASADDPLMVGKVLRVADVPSGSLLWQRDLMCEDVTPTTR